MQQVQQQAPPMSSKTMIGMMATLLIMMLVMSFREPIGQALDFVFRYIAFEDSPILTLIIAGLLMISFSTIVRSIMTNPIDMARNQQIQADFNKEFRQARIENNLFKLKKLQDQQPQIMAMSMEASTKQMKIMPITMLVIIPVYAWVWYFLKTGDGAPYFDGVEYAKGIFVSMPWGELNLLDPLWFIPSWIVIYSMISLPIGQIENRLIRVIFLKKRLNELDRLAKKAEIE